MISETRKAWHFSPPVWIFCFLLFIAFLYTFHPVLLSLVHTWYNAEEYSHGFLVIPISAYIVWQKRKTLKKTPVKPTRWGAVAIAISLLLYVFSVYGEIQTLKSLSLVFFIFAAVLFLFGIAYFRELIFPLIFLFFMIPVPSQIYSELTLWLQLLVTKICVHISQGIGLPVYRSGNVIELPAGTLQIVDACSGLRSMLSLLALSAVFGYLTLSGTINRLVLFASGVPIAILVNIFRVLIIILSLHYLEYDLSQDSIHSVFGTVVFVLALLLLFIVKSGLSKWETQS